MDIAHIIAQLDKNTKITKMINQYFIYPIYFIQQENGFVRLGFTNNKSIQLYVYKNEKLVTNSTVNSFRELVYELSYLYNKKLLDTNNYEYLLGLVPINSLGLSRL
jgi:hypothetical protein